MKKHSDNDERPTSDVLELLYNGIKKDYGRHLNKMSTDLQILIIKDNISNLEGALKYIREFKKLTL